MMVLGMHRSGTSALTRVFNLLGCDLPQTLIGANRTNEAGHWEAAPVARLNDQILESAGSTWDDWSEVNPDWFASPRSEEFREKAVEVLAAEFGASRIFVLKDPRICRLAPFWLGVLGHSGIRPIIVLPLRNPRDVAKSLKARNDFEPGFSSLLWLRHVLDSERATRGLPRCFTGYDDLLANWPSVMQHVCSRTGVAWPRYSAKTAAEIDSFLSDRFRHHNEKPGTAVENHPLSRWLRETYAIMLDWIRSGERAEDLPRLDAIRDELNVASLAFGRLIASGREDRKTIGRPRNEGVEQKAKVDGAVETVARLEAREKELGPKIEGPRVRLAEERGELSAEAKNARTQPENTIAEQAAEFQKLQAERDRAVADRVSAERKLWSRLDEIGTLTRLLQEKESRGGSLARDTQEESAVTIPGVFISGFMRFLPGRLRIRYQIQQLRKSGLFDPEWYVGYYEDIAKAGVDPYRHFIVHGAAERRSPNAKWGCGERESDLASL
ncbi:MAG: hypothetical protein AB7I50_18340 [Vicinamibacterales bacterium]